MRKIVNRKVYDTETATLLAEWENGFAVNDFHYCREQLFRTRKGEYFIHGRGGAASKYSEPRGSNTWIAGADIAPLSEDQALLWLESTRNFDVIERQFAAQIVEA